MGCNIPRPWKRPPTPAEKEAMEKAINEPLMTPNELRAAVGLNPIDEPIEELNYRVERTTNCPNCNAALSSDVCEYCGTRVGWDEGTVRGVFHSEPVVIPINIRGEQIDEIITSLRPFDQFGSTAHDFGISLPTKEQQ